MADTDAPVLMFFYPSFRVQEADEAQSRMLASSSLSSSTDIDAEGLRPINSSTVRNITKGSME